MRVLSVDVGGFTSEGMNPRFRVRVLRGAWIAEHACVSSCVSGGWSQGSWNLMFPGTLENFLSHPVPLHLVQEQIGTWGCLLGGEGGNSQARCSHPGLEPAQ